MNQNYQSNVIVFPLERVRSRIAAEPTAPNEGESVSRNQNSKVFNIDPYLPSARKIRLIENGLGIHQIPHRLYEFLFKAADSKVELLVLACLFRYTLGFRRSHCKASLSFIADWTGLCLSSVRRGIDGLLENKVIRQIEAGTLQHGSAIYEVPVIQAYMLFSAVVEVANKGEKPVGEAKDSLNDEGSKEGKSFKNYAQNEHSSEQNRQSSEQTEHSSVPNLSTKKYKSTNKTLNKDLNTHSQSESAASEYLNSYFDSLKPKNKKVRELKHFETLKDEYCLEDLADAVRFLVERGTPGKGEACHSPMAFLSCSIDSVLRLVILEREKALRRQERNYAEEEKKRQEAEKEAEDEAQYIRAVDAFKKTHPTKALQQGVFDHFYSRFPVYSQGSFELRAAAIREWYSTQSSGNASN